MKVNEKICSIKETYFIDQNQNNIEKVVIEYHDNGTASMGIYDVNGNDIGETVKGDLFNNLFKAIKEA